MRLICRTVLCLCFAALLAPFFIGAVLQAQEAPPIPPEPSTTDFFETVDAYDELLLGDAVFKEITLTPEGVVAIDTLGRSWFYDYASDRFVRDHRLLPTQTGTDDNLPPGVEPVEERCIKELRVSRPALKPVYVGYREFVEGDIIANDRVTVDGWVKGDIQSFSKLVLITASGRVDGDIRAPEIEVKDGAIVLGREIQTSPLTIPSDLILSSFSAAGIWVVLGLTLFLLLVAFLASTLGPVQFSNLDICMREHPGRTFGLGFLFIFLLPAVLVLMALTVVGIIVLPVVLAILIPAALAAGMMTSSRAVLRPLLRLSNDTSRSGLLIQAVTGVLLFMVIWVAVAILLGSGDEIARGFGYFFLVVAILVTTYPLFTGVGAMMLTRCGFRRYKSYKGAAGREGSSAPEPAPPPMPSAPGEGAHWPGMRPIPRPPRPHSPFTPPDKPPYSGDDR